MGGVSWCRYDDALRLALGAGRQIQALGDVPPGYPTKPIVFGCFWMGSAPEKGDLVIENDHFGMVGEVPVIFMEPAVPEHCKMTCLGGLVVHVARDEPGQLFDLGQRTEYVAGFLELRMEGIKNSRIMCIASIEEKIVAVAIDEYAAFSAWTLKNSRDP